MKASNKVKKGRKNTYESLNDLYKDMEMVLIALEKNTLGT